VLEGWNQHKMIGKMKIIVVLMTLMVIIMLIIIVIISLFYNFNEEDPLVAPSTSYYVANNGDDSNDGLSPATPWRTLSKVNSEFGNSISQGNDIYFNRGDTWTNEVLTPSLGGTSSEWMIFGAYGSGNKPVIDGTTNAIYYGSASSFAYVKFENLHITSTTGAGIVMEGTNTNNITFKQVDLDTGSGHLVLAYIDHYIVENCNVNGCGISIQGSITNRIGNGIIRNCTMTSSSDGITLHQSGGANQLVGANHWIENCTGWNNSENSFDITSGSNILLENCESYGCNMGGILVAHGVENVYIDNLYSHDENNGGITFVECNNTIVRNSVIYNFDGRGLYTGSDNSDPNDLTENLNVYNNDIVWYNGNNEHVQSDEDALNLIFKNNIFTSLNSTSPGLFIDIGNSETQTFEDINSSWANNIWWRGEGGNGSGSWWRDSSGTYTWAQWQAKSVTTGDIRSDPKLTNALNEDFTLQNDSPAIDAGTYLTQTVGFGNGTSVTLADASYFHDGFGLTDGDGIVVGSNKVTITDVDYRTNIITVDKSISWYDKDVVSLVYSGSAPDIGAYEFVSTAPKLHELGGAYLFGLFCLTLFCFAIMTTKVYKKHLRKLLMSRYNTDLNIEGKRLRDGIIKR